MGVSASKTDIGTENDNGFLGGIGRICGKQFRLTAMGLPDLASRYADACLGFVK